LDGGSRKVKADIPKKKSKWIAIDVRSLSSNWFAVDEEPTVYVPCAGGFRSELRQKNDDKPFRIAAFYGMEDSDAFLDSLADLIEEQYGSNAVLLDIRDAYWT
jgi:rhodanese-related sulfurtransferase